LLEAEVQQMDVNLTLSARQAAAPTLRGTKGILSCSPGRTVLKLRLTVQPGILWNLNWSKVDIVSKCFMF
jgi:hypothetical protein